MTLTPQIPYPVVIWDEPLLSAAATSVVRWYWHYDATLDEWSVNPDKAQSSGAPTDFTGLEDFSMTLTAGIPSTARQMGVTQRGADLLAY